MLLEILRLLENLFVHLIPVNRRIAMFRQKLVGFGIVGQGLVHLALDADIIDDEPLFLLLELAIDPRDGLDQGMSLNRLVDVKGISRLMVSPETWG